MSYFITSPNTAYRTSSNKVDSLSKALLDREERLAADLLLRFKNLVALATSPVEEGASMETAAAQALQMEVESAALVCESFVQAGEFAMRMGEESWEALEI